MFAAHKFIDTVQTFKKSVFNELVKDQYLQKVASNYLDAQTIFAKMLVDNTVSLIRWSCLSPKCFWNQKNKEESTAPYKVEPEVER